MSSNSTDAIALAEQLLQEIDRTELLLLQRSNQDASIPRKPGAWTPQQILGHLVDSAVNNHQRFVLAALHGSYRGEGYEQERWVELHQYSEMDWAKLVHFWAEINRFIAHTIQQIAPDRLAALCQVGEAAPMTLQALIADYLRHLRHHLDQIEESWKTA